MSYKAYITTLKEINPHLNADKLNIAVVFNNNVIIGKDLNVGDRVIYFPSDGQLNKELAEHCNLLRKKDKDGNNIGGYMDPDKRNVKAIKLRGEYSDGIVLPIQTLADFLGVDTTSLEDGPVDVLNGVELCRKYVPNKPKRSNNTNEATVSKKKLLASRYPLFHEHYDTQQLAYNVNQIKVGDKLAISLKIHGTSGRTSNTIIHQKQSLWQRIKNIFNPKSSNYELVSGTRRTILENFEGGYYGSNEFRRQWHDFFEGKLEKGETVYYEIVGYIDEDTLIMPQANNHKLKDKGFIKKYGDTTSFTYGCEPGQSDIYVYRMSMTNEDGFEVDYSTDYARVRCEQMGVKHAPIIYQISADGDLLHNDASQFMETINDIASGADIIDPTHIREGVVLRIENRDKFTAYKHKSYEFKVLESIIKEDAVKADIEEMESDG